MKRENIFIIISFLLTCLIMLLTNKKDNNKINYQVNSIRSSNYIDKFTGDYFLATKSQEVSSYINYYNLIKEKDFVLKYDNNFFSQHKLIIVTFPTSSGGDKYQLELMKVENNKFYLMIPKTYDGLTEDMAMWHFFIEINNDTEFNEVILNNNRLELSSFNY